jgi:hypothetical protein
VGAGAADWVNVAELACGAEEDDTEVVVAAAAVVVTVAAEEGAVVPPVKVRARAWLVSMT